VGAPRTKTARCLGAGLLFLCGSLAAGREARAAGPLVQGAPISTNDYGVDLFQGPVLASARVTALAGAYTAIAEGSEGIPFNAAAASLRPAYSTTRDDFDLTGSITFSNLPILGAASVIGTDFDNNGQIGFHDPTFVWANAGFTIQHDQWGIGAIGSMQQYSLGAPPGAVGITDAVVRLFRVDSVASYGFFGERLHVGAGLRAVVFDAVDATGSEKLLFRSAGAGVQAGALWAPRDLPLRVGATVRSPVLESTNQDSGADKLGSFHVPARIELPWELEWGAAVQLGPRPLNVAWVDEDTLVGPAVERERRVTGGQIEPAYKAARRILKRRYAAIPREKVLLSFSMLVTGPSGDAVGFESMLAQRVDRSGQRATVTTRAGAEAEVWPNRLQLRAGTYVEPTRFDESRARLHGTFGFDVRLFESTVWGLFPEHTSFRFTTGGDAARDYFGYSLAVGVWH
jgi:hypothetical protein